MNFAGVDTWAIVLAGVGGYIVGAFWYWGFSKPWMDAQGFTPESMKANTSAFPYILVFVANLIMATALAAYMGGTTGVSIMLILLALITLTATLFARETKGDALL